MLDLSDSLQYLERMSHPTRKRKHGQTSASGRYVIIEEVESGAPRRSSQSKLLEPGRPAYKRQCVETKLVKAPSKNEVKCPPPIYIEFFTLTSGQSISMGDIASRCRLLEPLLQTSSIINRTYTEGRKFALVQFRYTNATKESILRNLNSPPPGLKIEFPIVRAHEVRYPANLEYPLQLTNDIIKCLHDGALSNENRVLTPPVSRICKIEAGDNQSDSRDSEIEIPDIQGKLRLGKVSRNPKFRSTQYDFFWALPREETATQIFQQKFHAEHIRHIEVLLSCKIIFTQHMRGYMSFVEREDTPELHKLAELGVFLMNCVVELFFQRTTFILASNNPFYYLSEDAMKDVRVASRNEYLCEPIQMLGSWLEGTHETRQQFNDFISVLDDYSYNVKPARVETSMRSEFRLNLCNIPQPVCTVQRLRALYHKEHSHVLYIEALPDLQEAFIEFSTRKDLQNAYNEQLPNSTIGTKVAYANSEHAHQIQIPATHERRAHSPVPF